MPVSYRNDVSFVVLTMFKNTSPVVVASKFLLTPRAPPHPHRDGPRQDLGSEIQRHKITPNELKKSVQKFKIVGPFAARVPWPRRIPHVSPLGEIVAGQNGGEMSIL